MAKKLFYGTNILLLLIYLSVIVYLCFSPQLPVQLPPDSNINSHIFVGKAPVAYVPFEEIKQLGFYLNILMTIPFGFLISSLTKGKIKFKKNIIIAILIGVVIEGTQFIMDNLGFSQRWVDINDVIANGTGFIIGYYISKLIIVKIIKK